MNFLTSKMVIDYSSDPIDIIKFVRNSGYDASLLNAPPMETGRSPKNMKRLLTIISGLAMTFGLILKLGAVKEEIQIIFFAVAMLSGGFYVAKSGLHGLKSLSLDMNFLMTISAIGAAAIGEWSEAAAVVFLFSLGNTLQAMAMDRTRKSIKSLMDIAPTEALIRRQGIEAKIPVEEIKLNDLVIVKPGERIPVDGTVVKGISSVNQAPITGESIPVQRVPGDQVYAGTINQQGALEIEVTKLVADTTLARIIKMVEEAQAQKAPSQQFVEVFAKYYTPVVVLAAIGIAVIPSLLFAKPFMPWFDKALILLVISCPCALVISTPVAIVSAIGNAARNGVLIKGGAFLEEAGAIKAIAFDKTGTLTAGKPAVTDFFSYCEDKRNLLSIVASIEGNSEHPLASAVMACAREEGVKMFDVTAFETLTGQGVRATIGQNEYFIGNQALFESKNIQLDAEAEKDLAKLQKAGKSVMLVGNRGKLMGLIGVEDKVRNESKKVIEDLYKENIEQVIMLTGDNQTTAGAIAGRLGISQYKAELMPGDKLEIIRDLQARYGPVAMIGDGINDAPALATANLGIAMGAAGTDIALETADIALMSDDLTKLPFIIRLGRKTISNIKENITFSLVIKAIFLVLTFMGLSNLWMAVFADTGAALIVIANGMRMLRVKAIND